MSVPWIKSTSLRLSLPSMLVFGAAALTTQSFAQVSVEQKDGVLQRMDARAEHFGKLSRRIWEFAEISGEEFSSSTLLKTELQVAGFQIRTNVAGMPTAFIANWGKGEPVIGILGEFDALPGMGQEPLPEKKSPGADRSGHACGHNLLGAGSAFACIAVKEFLEAHDLPGTIRFYGCPAEETFGGKLFMIRDGAFSDCDVALTWHPDDRNQPGMKSTLAASWAYFRFHGTAAHAARFPEKGRSALDAVMLTTHALELLREHVPQETRIHYVITKGGAAANIVPDFCELDLTLRHPEMPLVEEIWSRVLKCGQAGALATETKFEVAQSGSYSNILPNDALAALFEQNMQRVTGVSYSKEEEAFAGKIRVTLASENLPLLGSEKKIAAIESGYTSWSTDVGDVSWIVPTGEIRAATFVPGVSAHTWQATACAGMSIGQKGMVVAAKTLALTAIDLLTYPNQIAAARESFKRRLAGRTYRTKLAPDEKPPIKNPNSLQK